MPDSPYKPGPEPQYVANPFENEVGAMRMSRQQYQGAQPAPDLHATSDDAIIQRLDKLERKLDRIILHLGVHAPGEIITADAANPFRI